MPWPTSLVVKKGSKNPGEPVRGDAGAGVADRDRDEVAARRGTQTVGGDRLDPGRGDEEPPLAVHRVAGVDREIHDGGVELARIGMNPERFAGEIGLDRDPRAEQRARHLAHAAEIGDDVEGFGPERLPTGEGEQLTGQPGRAGRRVGNRLEVAAAAVFGETGPTQEIDRAADDGQQIVEVMGDSPGQLADRLHFLRLAQLLLRLGAPAHLRPDPGERALLAPRPAQGGERRQGQRERGADRDGEIPDHAAPPFRRDRRGRAPGDDIDGMAGHLPVGVEAFGAPESMTERLR